MIGMIHFTFGIAAGLFLALWISDRRMDGFAAGVIFLFFVAVELTVLVLRVSNVVIP
jgi:hypothetical protein